MLKLTNSTAVSASSGQGNSTAIAQKSNSTSITTEKLPSKPVDAVKTQVSPSSDEFEFLDASSDESEFILEKEMLDKMMMK